MAFGATLYRKRPDTVGEVGSSGKGGEARVVSFRLVTCRLKLLLHQPADHVAHEHDVVATLAGRTLGDRHAVAHRLVEQVRGPSQDVAALPPADGETTRS